MVNVSAAIIAGWGIISSVVMRDKPAGKRMRTWNGLFGTTAEFIYVYSVAILASSGFTSILFER